MTTYSELHAALSLARDYVEKAARRYHEGAIAEACRQEAGRRLLLIDAALSSPASSAGRPSDDELWDQSLAERDRYHERADELAGAIAAHLGIDIGEHSNLNDPWQNALTAIASSAGMDAQRLFSPMYLAPLDGTPVLLHIPTATDKFAVGRWTDGHGSGWIDDEERFLTHTPVSFMALGHLETYTIAAIASKEQP